MHKEYMDILQSVFGSTSSAEIGTSTAIALTRADGTLEEDVLAQVSTGDEWSRLDRSLAERLGLYSPEQVLRRQEWEPDELGGRKQLLDVIAVTAVIAGRTIRGEWLVTDRSQERLPVVLGKNELGGFVVRV